MFYDWLFFRKLVEHPCMAVRPILCIGKKNKKEIKPLGPLRGPLIKSLVNGQCGKGEKAHRGAKGE